MCDYSFGGSQQEHCDPASHKLFPNFCLVMFLLDLMKPNTNNEKTQGDDVGI